MLPDEPTINDTLGWIYYRKGLATLAIPVLKQAADRDPRNYLYRYHLGLAYAKAGDKANARKSLETALELKPNAQEASDARRVLETVKG